DIREFADLNACELRHRSFSRDVDALIEDLAETVAPALASSSGPVPATSGDVPPAHGAGAQMPQSTGGAPLPPNTVVPPVPGQYAVPGAAGGVAPQGPYAPPPPVVTLSGMWQSPVGAFHTIQQHGTAVT